MWISTLSKSFEVSTCKYSETQEKYRAKNLAAYRILVSLQKEKKLIQRMEEIVCYCTPSGESSLCSSSNSISDMNSLTGLLQPYRCILNQSWLQFNAACMIPLLMIQSIFTKTSVYEAFWYVSRIHSPVWSLFYKALRSILAQTHFFIASLWNSALLNLNEWEH